MSRLATMDEYCQDDHLLTMKAHQIDTLKNDCFLTMNGCRQENHLITMKVDQLDALRNDR